MASGKAVVKGVLSGDTILLQGSAPASGGPPPEKQLTLSSLMAPRLGRKDAKDEPFAWPAREFLRKKLVGKLVTFRVDYVIAPREYGSVYLGEENVACSIVAEGLAKVKQGRSGQGQSPAYEELVRLEQLAQQDNKGVWNKDPGVSATTIRDVIYSGTEEFNANDLVENSKKGGRPHPVPAIIEQVRDASTLRVLLLPTMHNALLYLSGVQAPGFKKPDTPEGQEVAQPFAREAKHFVESRLLHRDVQVLLEGVDKNQHNVHGTIVHPQGNISVELVKAGLAKVVDWSARFTPVADQLRAAQRHAQRERAKLWHDFQPQEIVGTKEFNARVLEIFSGDQIAVLDHTGSTRRVFLASVRAPKMGNARKAEKDQPWSWESKEFIRKKIAGKKVKVVIEYVKTPQPGQTIAEGRSGEMEFASIFVDRNNIGEQLVAAGLANVARHRAEEPRSEWYEALLAAEKQAESSKKGVHSDREPPVHHFNDLMGQNQAKAKQFEPYLKRERQNAAVVEYVFIGNRMKVRIPKESCMISFILAGIRCPAPSRPGQPGDKYGDDALNLTKEFALQQDVEVEVDTVDKGGNFIGTMMTSRGNLAVLLLEAGLASTIGFSADQSRFSSELYAAEGRAKRARLGIWENYDEAAEKAMREMSISQEKQEEVVNFTITEIVDGGHFFCHVQGDSGIQNIDNKMRAFSMNAEQASHLKEPIKKGTLCAAKFTADDNWYRAKVDSQVGDGEYKVLFIDYGNSDVVNSQRLRQLDPTILAAPAQARECKLAYVKVPSLNDEFGEDAAVMFHQLAWGKNLVAKVVGRDATGVLSCVLFDADNSGEGINQQMVQRGLGRVDKRAPSSDSLVASLRADEEVAKRDRAYVWSYGDISDEEDEEFSKDSRRKDRRNR
eukprot:GILJ01003593.1.p1 GENE.GILJ01003593.1~~GILJ01003593.1.p1  ORF type:complete len:893 (-),score=162.87 GILJ01003593.1:168-2846(-)